VAVRHDEHAHREHLGVRYSAFRPAHRTDSSRERTARSIRERPVQSSRGGRGEPAHAKQPPRVYSLVLPAPWPHGLTPLGVWTVVNLAFTGAATRKAHDESVAIHSLSRWPAFNPRGGPGQWNTSKSVRW
jgi:hypothetical protein